jgi:transcription initiation factor TFIIB
MSFDIDSDVWTLLDKLHDDPHTDPNEDQVSAMSSTNSILVCQFCKSTNVILEEGNYTCKSCFSIVSRFIDSSPEWRYYGPDDNNRGVADPTRCGPPTSDLLPGLGSLLGSTGRESHALRIVQKYQFWNSMTYRERSLYSVFEQLTSNAINHGIPGCIIEEAKVLYKRMTDLKVSRGENRQALIAASIYVSCKSNQVPRSVKEIASMFNVKVTALTKGCKLFQQQLLNNASIKSSAPADFVGRFCSKLNLDQGVVKLCRYILQKTDELCVVCESTPPSIVAGSLQLCNVELNLGLSKMQMAEACHISQVTIAKCYKKMQPHKAKLLPPNLNEFMQVHAIS